MTRQEEFKQKLFALLREYKVEMKVEEDDRGHATGINFWAYTEFDEGGYPIHERIDLMVGVWEDGKE